MNGSVLYSSHELGVFVWGFDWSSLFLFKAL